jgi:hypothetical protein
VGESAAKQAQVSLPVRRIWFRPPPTPPRPKVVPAANGRLFPLVLTDGPYGPIRIKNVFDHRFYAIGQRLNTTVGQTVTVCSSVYTL